MLHTLSMNPHFQLKLSCLYESNWNNIIVRDHPHIQDCYARICTASLPQSYEEASYLAEVSEEISCNTCYGHFYFCDSFFLSTVSFWWKFTQLIIIVIRFTITLNEYEYLWLMRSFQLEILSFFLFFYG